MTPLDDLVGRIWNPDVRPMAQEAKVAYEAGAFRGCVVLTWVCVAADLFRKIQILAEDKEPKASAFAKKLVGANPSDPSAIADLQQAERDVLSVAEELDLIDPIGRRQLERIRDDRHLCAHPTLQPSESFFTPNAETARAHLSNAAEVCLTHPATQGRRAVERFAQRLSEPGADCQYLKRIFFDQATSATGRNVLELAAKHALLALPVGDDDETTTRVANVAAEFLRYVAETDRPIVAERLRGLQSRLSSLGQPQLLDAVVRLGCLDVFWDQLAEVELARLRRAVVQIPIPGPWAEIESETHVQVLGLLAVQSARAAVPELTACFSGLASRARTQVIAANPDAYFVKYVPELLRDAHAFRTAETVTQSVVLPLAHAFEGTDLAAVLHEWQENDQCAQAAGMVAMSVTLFENSSHLLPESKPTWRAFLDQVRSGEPGEWYWYKSLGEAIEQA